jgi:hypothetical protein
MKDLETPFLSACKSGYETAVKLLLESKKVTAEHIGATDKVMNGRGFW